MVRTNFDSPLRGARPALAIATTLPALACLLMQEACSLKERAWSTPPSATDGSGGAIATEDAGAADAHTTLPTEPPDVDSTLPVLRRQVTISARGTSVPEEYSVSVRFDHAALVAAGRSKPGGDDVKIMRFTGDHAEEIDRVADPSASWNQAATQIWFRTQEAIGASEEDSTYYLYYGYTGASAPKSDPKKVYLFWDGFEDPHLGEVWTYDNIGDANGWVDLSGGVLRLAAQSEDIGRFDDSLAFLSTAVAGDLSADTRVVGFGGLLDSRAKIGGVMIRQDASPRSRHRLVGRQKRATRHSLWRQLDGGVTSKSERSIDGESSEELSRLDLIGGKTKAYASADGEQWEQLGPEVDFLPPLEGSVLVGIPLATRQNGSDGWVEVDWFRIRKLVSPEPAATLSAEEQAEPLRAP